MAALFGANSSFTGGYQNGFVSLPGRRVGNPQAGQTILISIYSTVDAGFGFEPPTGPGDFPIVSGRGPSPGYANLTYETNTAACCSGVTTYLGLSGTVTVTAIGPGGITGSFSATAASCKDLDGGTIALSGAFETKTCSQFDIVQCQTCGC